MICKIVRKLGMGNLVLRMSNPFLRSACVLPSLSQAESILRMLNPDPASTCLCPELKKEIVQVELDIIIPAYNEEKYIARCIDSALMQQRDCNFRLIVINDGSTDTTANILAAYEQHPQVIILHQENKGFSGARNSGLAVSNAEYIMFLDSDDTLPAGAIKALMDCAKENNAALVEGAFTSTDPYGRTLSTTAHPVGFLDCNKDFFGFTGMKVISSALLKGIHFPEGYWYEDSIMAQIIYPIAKKQGLKAYGISDCVYNYTVNPNGISHTSRKRPKCIDSLWITLQLHKDREKLGLEKDQAYYDYILSMIVLSYRRAEKQSEDVKKAMFVLWREFLSREFSGFESSDSKYLILQQALHGGNFALYSAACKLI